MQQWATALGCDFCTPQVMDSKHDLESIPGPVYIKYNAHAKTSYLQAYTGRFRGVIVQVGQKQRNQGLRPELLLDESVDVGGALVTDIKCSS
ncbi:hypothetical protein GOP47_0018880 [Adiantum capillus-veneris]|uniref:Uncharacterized protein n=1 Tax=Adiantum capillus-veneris TaxID=13818 RepID=A0A9D4UFF9_ADICA|nr:hypothetical protein GOP47_0018880 [Adiantum capillus-veneris]